MENLQIFQTIFTQTCRFFVVFKQPIYNINQGKKTINNKKGPSKLSHNKTLFMKCKETLKSMTFQPYHKKTLTKI
jgi:hypothetical protein